MTARCEHCGEVFDATIDSAGEPTGGGERDSASLLIDHLRQGCHVRLKRHVSTLCALLNGVAVNAALDTRGRAIRDTIKAEIGES